MTRPLVTTWFYAPLPRPDPVLRLICLPPAGGDGVAFAGLAHLLPEHVELLGLRMPGRGGRQHESFPGRFTEFVEQVAEAVRPYADRPYVLLGQSMGALVAAEVCAVLRDSAPATGCVVVALAPPHRWDGPPGGDVLDDPDAFLTLIGSEAAPLLHDESLRDLVLRPLRADLELCQGVGDRTGLRLDCALHALAGSEDSTTTPEEMAEWARYTSGPFTSGVVRAGHLVVQSGLARTAVSIAGFLDTLPVPGSARQR